jgi:hypothetical protein
LRGTRHQNQFSTALLRVPVLILALCCLALSACGGPKNFTNENDALRRQNLELRDKAAQLQKQIDLRLAEIATLRAKNAAATQPALEGADIPRVVKLRPDRYSGAIDTNSDGTDDTVRLYIQTIDQQGRFLPAAGRAVVQVVAITPGSPPALLAEKAFSPSEFDAAYRTGLTGTHYSLEVPLDTTTPAGSATVKITFTDAATHATLTAELPVSIAHRGDPAARP